MTRDIRAFTEYVHDEDDEYSDLWPTDAKQHEKFHYRLYETEFGMEVDMKTGETRIISVNKVPLITPTPWG